MKSIYKLHLKCTKIKKIVINKHPKFKISVDLFLLNVLEKDNKRGIIERLIKINKGNKVYAFCNGATWLAQLLKWLPKT